MLHLAQLVREAGLAELTKLNLLFTILFYCANNINIAGKILPRWLLDSKTLNGHFAAVLSFLILYA